MWNVGINLKKIADMMNNASGAEMKVGVGYDTLQRAWRARSFLLDDNLPTAP